MRNGIRGAQTGLVQPRRFNVLTGRSRGRQAETRNNRLAQINGRDEISIQAKVALEKEYLERKSVWFDLGIVVRTFMSVLFSKGVAH